MTTSPLAAHPEIHDQISLKTTELTRKFGRAPTATELADALGIDRNDVVDVLVDNERCCTGPIGSGNVVGNAPAMADRLSHWAEILDGVQDAPKLRRILAELPEQERSVVILRIFASWPQSAIAERLGVSPKHVSRLLEIAFGKLRDHLGAGHAGRAPV